MVEESAISSTSESRELAQQLNAVTLKRPASPSIEESEAEGSRKRVKDSRDGDANSLMGVDSNGTMFPIVALADANKLAENLAQELQCACCSELVHRPVVVSPCQHFFCGSCCVLWVRNGGTNCPSCRGVSTSVTPSRPLQVITEVLIRAVPSKARKERERMQADEIYKAGTSLRIPPPREASPEPTFNRNGDFAYPCPHCVSGNAFGWRCLQPIPNPNDNPDNAWNLENGLPPGHSYCGNCDNLLALQAPATTKCDLCQVSFCGIGVHGRCCAVLLRGQDPHGMSDISDLIQSFEVYECFDGNTVEVEIMLDYLTSQELTPRHIYREVVEHIQSQPRGFTPLIESELFMDIHGVVAGVDPDPGAPRNMICRLCAREVLLWGLREWWVRERLRGFLDEALLNRPNCVDGRDCARQKCLAHAKEFNHIISPLEQKSEAVSIPESEQTRSSDPIIMSNVLPPVTDGSTVEAAQAQASVPAVVPDMPSDSFPIRMVIS